MKGDNVITYEQAVKMPEFDSVVEVYETVAMEMMRYFSSNPLAQLTQTQFYYDLMDLTQAYFEKDYSNYLFKETLKMHEEFKTVLPELSKATEAFQTMAALYTKLIIK